MSKKGGFGSSKILPGQANYRVSESVILDREAKDMENKLRVLQDKLQQQQMEDASVTRTGGSRWKGARNDRGTLRDYSTDVQERQARQKKRAEEKPRQSKTVTASAKQEPQPAINPNFANFASSAKAPAPIQQEEDKNETEFEGKEIAEWTVGDVVDWLTAVNLSQYADAFIQNDISGPILLDMSLEDLDYMKINALGHRKIILKSVELFRREGRMSMSSAIKAENSTVKPRPQEALPKVPEKEQGGVVHWSHLEPLANNGVVNEYQAPNGCDEVLDEEAEHAAFRDAVSAWRNAGKAPVVPSNEPYKTDNELTSHPLFAKKPVEQPAPAYNPASGTGASPESDTLDEAKERAEFQRAVMEWRNGPSAAKATPAGTSAGTGTGTGTSAGPSGLVPSAADIADKLAKELDDQHLKTSQLIQQQKQAAIDKLHLAKENTVNRQEMKSAGSDREPLNVREPYCDDVDSDEDFPGFTPRMAVEIPVTQNVSIAFLDSVLGSPDTNGVVIDSDYCEQYFVDEGDSDEDDHHFAPNPHK